MLRNNRVSWLLLLALLLTPNWAWAHTEPGAADGLVSGFRHPLTGLDHLVAMVAVGLWGAQLGAPAIWLLPIAFPLVMALGGVLGILGVVLPMPDVFVAVSALVLGGVVALGLRAPVAVACAVVAVFAIFHGYAHGVGMRSASNAVAYGVGFVTATGLLHLVGIAIGTLTRWRAGALVVKAAGAGVVAIGLVTLIATVMAA